MWFYLLSTFIPVEDSLSTYYVAIIELPAMFLDNLTEDLFYKVSDWPFRYNWRRQTSCPSSASTTSPHWKRHYDTPKPAGRLSLNERSLRAYLDVMNRKDYHNIAFLTRALFRFGSHRLAILSAGEGIDRAVCRKQHERHADDHRDFAFASLWGRRAGSRLHDSEFVIKG